MNDPPTGVAPHRALPGWAIDLATDGVRGESLTRRGVVTATRRVMMSAHRSGWQWPDVQELLTDTHHRRLAVQIATGHGGRTIAARVREDFLRRHWDDTEKVIAARRPWGRDDALAFIQVVQDRLDASALPHAQRNVLQVVIDLANQHGTSRPAVPVRVIAKQTGLSKSAAQRVLAHLADDGDWLALAQRGDYRRSRASLYSLAPALAATYEGATPPESHPPPKSQVPKSHERPPHMLDVTLRPITREEEAVMLTALAKFRSEQPYTSEERPLRVVGEGD